MKEWIAVAMGGMLGALLRHSLTGLFSLFGPAWVPIATLAANALGCFAIGALAVWSIQFQANQQWLAVGIRVGLLGGLTTFSSFALDVVRIWQTDRIYQSSTLAASHVVIGITAVLSGIAMAQSMTNAEPAT